MPSLTLELDNRDEIAEVLDSGRWIVACLCAAWCGTCTSYRTAFDTLAERQPDIAFLWIDIEDQADVVGDLDVENFPTLLVQRGDTVAFFGTMLPEAALAQRMVLSLIEQSDEELARLAHSSQERQQWQRDCNLLRLLKNAQA
ncbi:thioredoxin family protein [Massilia horti]|uniref:Thioredoxin n=1 Tax=Massilia horti TaxID=2562153 RepID=A0A4Y9ST74_9BURK|nr:thioredoxin family protein [Massilia horti]TFW28687.1 thioredoxin [Massilia horti]